MAVASALKQLCRGSCLVNNFIQGLRFLKLCMLCSRKVRCIPRLAVFLARLCTRGRPITHTSAPPVQLSQCSSHAVRRDRSRTGCIAAGCSSLNMPSVRNCPRNVTPAAVPVRRRLSGATGARRRWGRLHRGTPPFGRWQRRCPARWRARAWPPV